MIMTLNRYTAPAVKLAWRGIQVARSRGWRAFLRRGTVKVARRMGRDWHDAYQDWVEDTAPSSVELAAQRRWSASDKDRPLITLVVRAEGRPSQDLSRTIHSIRRQTYPHWRLIVVGAVDRPPLTVDHRKRRFVIVGAAPSADIRSRLAEALRGSHGDYVGIMRAGDTLSPEALYELARAILGQTPRPDVLYCDEDHIGATRRARRWPVFKPSWSPEMLLGYHYTGRLTVARRELIEEVGDFDPSIGVSAEWDLMLRLAIRTDRVARVAMCLYHNRRDVDVREEERSCPRRHGVLEAHLDRLGLAGAEVVEQTNGTFRVVWPLDEAPLVSVIVQTDCPERIRRCIEFLREGTDYPNQEIILIESGGTELVTLADQEDWSSSGPVRVITLDNPVPTAEAWNAGAAVACGQYLLFLNDDVKARSSDWLEELVRWAQRPGVAVVGTKLLDPDGSVHHAGIVVGGEGIVVGGEQGGEGSDIFRAMSSGDDGTGWGLFGPVDTYRNYLAVSGTCLLIPRRLFEECGPFDEKTLVAGHDVGLCLEAVRRGYRIASTPYAGLSRRGMRWSDDPIGTREDHRLIARILRDAGIEEDPYWHPHLGPWPGPPSIRPTCFPSARDVLRNQVDEFLAPDRSGPGLDVRDDASLREALADLASSFSIPSWTPSEVGSDPQAAVRFVLDLLRRDGELLQAFPRALSEGPDGAFCRWLCSEAVSRYGLPAEAPEMIRKAFESRLAAKVRQIYEVCEGLTRAFPLAYLPEGRVPFFRWLVARGRVKYGLTDEQILWFLLECDEEPARELVRTYRISPGWQKFFPDALTAFGWERFSRWLSDRYAMDVGCLDYRHHSDLGPLDELRLAYHCRGDWKRRFPEAMRTERGTQALIAWLREHEGVRNPRIVNLLRHVEEEIAHGRHDRLGMNVLAHFCCNSTGLQISSFAFVDSLRTAGVATSCRDVPVDLTWGDMHRDRYLGLEAYNATLIHVQPEPLFPIAYYLARLAPRRDVYRIGMWLWETDRIPDEWRAVSRLVNEVWTASRFVAEGLCRSLDVPVHHLTPGLRIDPIGRISRARYGIAPDRFIFLFMFDMSSILERKNPLGLIAAFKEAFRRDDKAALVIKVSRGRSDPDGMARLRRAADEVGAIIVDQVLPRDEVIGLLDACDCYVSLHRCEALGLTMAEAMLLGKPTIATAYSGNLDFMDTSNSLLVGYKLVEIEEDVYLFRKGDYWAEPSIAEAARAMRWVFENRDAACELGERARITAGDYFSPEAAGRRMAQRLAQIRRERFGIGCDEESSLIQA